MRSLSLAALLCAVSLAGAQAQDGQFRFTLGGGAAYAPTYPGSDDYEAVPSGVLRFQSLRLPNGFAVGDPAFDRQAMGFGLRGAFDYIGERDDSDSPRLAGTDDLDASLELGIGAQYVAPAYRVFGEVRYGVTGHESFVGELGADLVARPTDRFTLMVGPRATFGSSGYSDYYFGVSDAEAGAAALAGNGAIGGAYDGGSGLVSAGMEVTARYQINGDWGLEGSLSYERLQDDAARSPVVSDRDQVGISLNLTRRFTLDF